MPTQEEFYRVEADPRLVVGGCAISPDSWETECLKCGYETLLEGGRSVMDVRVTAGEMFESKGSTLRVSDLEEEVLPRVREYLIGIARAGNQVTYGRLKEGASLPHAVNGMGHLLDALSEDCFLRDEPSLAALVVSAATGRIGESFSGDVQQGLADVYAHWQQP